MVRLRLGLGYYLGLGLEPLARGRAAAGAEAATGSSAGGESEA